MADDIEQVRVLAPGKGIVLENKDDLVSYLNRPESQLHFPPGTGENYKFTLDDHEAYMDAFEAMAEERGGDMNLGDRPYDVLQDYAINNMGYEYERPPEEYYEERREAERVRDESLSNLRAQIQAAEDDEAPVTTTTSGPFTITNVGMKEDNPFSQDNIDSRLAAMREEYAGMLPDTEAVARKVLPSPTKGPEDYHLEQYDRGALMEEQGRKAGMRLPKEFKEAFDQYEYNKDQEDLKTPGYNKRGVDNPYGGE